jgi:hypothetical protein
MIRPTVGLILIVVLAGCSFFTKDPYPLPVGPPHAWQTGPFAVGSKTRAVVPFLTPRPGDRIELLAAEPIGVAPVPRCDSSSHPQCSIRTGIA